MFTSNPEAAYRAAVAEACIEFSNDLLEVRESSVSANDAQSAAKDLFSWMRAQQALTENNYRIAVHAIDFGRQLLRARHTATLQEATAAIQNLYTTLIV